MASTVVCRRQRSPPIALHVAWHAGSSNSGAPLIAAGTAWVNFNNGHTQAIDLASGAVLADVRITGDLQGFPQTTVTPTAVCFTGTTFITAIAN